MNSKERICGCFNITVDDIISAKQNGCKSVEEIVKVTKAGRACGRCKEKAELTIIKVLQNRLYIK